MRRIIFFIMTAAILTLRAEESADTLPSESYRDALELSEVVVTGTRVPRLLKDTPVQTKVIASRDIERMDATDIRDLLQQAIPGVEFSYAMNQQVHMNLGGFGGQSVLFLVDGERLAGETMDDVDFSRIDMNNVERIEIVRGASSALYGSNAVGGVINIITKQASKRFGGNADFRIGRHGDRRYTASFSAKGSHVGNTLSASASRMDSYDVVNAPDPAARVVSNIYGHKTFNVSDQVRWEPLKTMKISTRAGFFMRELPRQVDAPERYRSYSAGLRGDWEISANDHLELAYSFDQYDKSQYRRLNGLDIRHYSDVMNSVRAFYTHTFSQKGILSCGADFSHEYLLNTKLADSDCTQDNFDIFAQYDWKLLDCLEIVGAARYDWFSEGNLSRLTPKVSLRYTPLGSMNIRAAYGMGFRTPTLKEKYYEFDMAGIWIVKGNPSLRPETSHNLDLSAEYTKGNYNFTMSGFFNRVKNRISTGLPYSLPSDPRQLYLNYINLADYRSAGVELSAQAAWNNGLKTQLCYAYIHEHTVRDRQGNQYNNQYMPPRPHSLTLSLDWGKSWRKGFDFNVGINGRFLSVVSNYEYKDYYNIEAGTKRVKYPAYTLWKLFTSQTIAEKVKITLALDNLFNYRPRYYYLNAPLTDGISLLAGIAIQL